MTSRSRLRLLFGGLAVMVLAPALFSQQAQPVPATVPPAGADAKNKPQSIDVMTFPSDRDAKNMIQAVKDYLKEYETKLDKAPWDKICTAAQQVLDEKSDSFFELPKATPDAPPRRISAKAEINRLIGQFPSAGRQFYQLNFSPQAENLLTSAKTKGYDRAILADVSQRYFHTKPGANATLILAGVQLDRGNFIEAAYSYERLLNRPESDDLWTPRTIVKAMAAIKRAGAGAQSESWQKLNAMLEKKFPRDGLTIGTRAFSREDLLAEIDRPFESLYGRVGEAFVSMRYGNPSHTAIGEGGAPFLDKSFSIDMPYRSVSQFSGNVWVRQNVEDVLRTTDIKKDLLLPGFFPTTTQNLVFFRNYDGVYAVITKDGFSNHGKPARAGDIYWYTHLNVDSGSLTHQVTLPHDKETEANWRYFRDQANQKSILFDNPLVGSLTHDGQNVYFVDDLAIPPPPQQQNENMGIQPLPASGKGTPLAEGSRLCAHDAITGMLRWKLGESLESQPLAEEAIDKTEDAILLTQGSYFLGPPLPLNGKLYVLAERNGVIRLLCLDPNRILIHRDKRRIVDRETGTAQDVEYPFTYPAVVWSQRLGEPNVKLPLDAFRRYQCSYLAYADGVLVCPTNSGAVIAVDIMSRSLLWAKSYRAIKQANANDAPQNRVRVMINGQMNSQSVLDPNRWRAAAPIISQGRVVFAAYDSDALYCVDLRTGDALWTEPRKAGDLYVGGLIDDRVLIVGKDAMRAVKLLGTVRPAPKPDGREDVVAAWKDLKISAPAGHGAASKGGLYYLPVANGGEHGEPQVWAIDTNKGTITGKAAYRQREGSTQRPMLGNLVFHEGQLISQSPTEVAVFPLLELKKQEMDRRLAANPNDPEGLTARGEILLDDGDVKAAIRDFTAASRNKPSEASSKRLREKKYIAYTELLRKNFLEGEPYLDEYKDLCNLAVEADDPNQKLRLISEKLKRQRLFLEIVARGREAQGRLVEAFDLYLQYATLGGSKELVEISDEPGVQTRPDVWARGRIEAMISNAQGAARKPLEARVAEEWTRVKTAADLNKLREFVAVFGHHFESGRDAQLELAERLIALDTEETAHEAQTILSKIQATTDDSGLAARAVEMLARLMIRRGQMETAVGFYSQLGHQYALQTIRDNRTGADFFNDLLTDKRLLPYIEPGRQTSPTRTKIVTDFNQNNLYVQQGYVIDPDGGESEPYFRRHRLTLSNNDSGNGTWTLRSNDRVTGEEKAKFTNLKVITPNNTINFRIAQAQGSLMLMHLGTAVHCFDMMEKKILWEYSVFGDNHKVDAVQATATIDDEVDISNSDGTKFTLGRTTILAPNYAGLVTRDGLVVLDPNTGSKLWARTSVSPAARIFGDSRHIFVVETVAGKTTSRVFRAIDGAPVDGVPDFGPQASGQARIRIVGRNILLSEGGRLKPLTIHLYDPLSGKDIWTRSYETAPEPEEFKNSGIEYNGQAKLIRTMIPDYVGALRRDGRFEVLDCRSGNVVFQSRIDAAHIEAASNLNSQPILLADADRFYLVLNRSSVNDPRAAYGFGYGNSLRTLNVNGPVYAFHRASGARLWWTDSLFEGQQLVIERFTELPALVSATNTTDDQTQPQGTYRVIVFDKATGRVRFRKNMSQSYWFYGLSTDPRLGTAVFFSNSGKITIQPDDDVKPVEAK